VSLVTENGTGQATAESYISVANADARHTAFGNTAWTGTDAVKEQALRRATAYMTQAYRGRWTGTKLTSAQALDWPRWGVMLEGFPVASDSIPADIANACADLALKALADDLAPDLTRAIVREKVGPLETEYAAYSSQATSYRAIDMALSAYLTGAGAMAQLVRT
jgi:hypothetical protein